jgi:Flp pilus assembly protein TadG
MRWPGFPWRGSLRRVYAEHGATLAEFAFTLPFLVVILYAVFDFGGALTLKQKLEAAVYESARAGASQSTRDLSSTTVGTNGSVADLRDVVARHLQDAGINDCGLLGAAPTSSNPSAFQWIYAVNANSCPASLTLTIERQQVVSASSGGVTVRVIYTHVRLQYPFQWRLSRVIQLLVPGGTFPSSAIITVDANMQNLT